jgi:hypothetical protein
VCAICSTSLANRFLAHAITRNDSYSVYIQLLTLDCDGLRYCRTMSCQLACPSTPLCMNNLAQHIHDHLAPVPCKKRQTFLSVDTFHPDTHTEFSFNPCAKMITIQGLYEKLVDWQQCAAVVHRETVTIMPSCSGGGNIVVVWSSSI